MDIIDDIDINEFLRSVSPDEYLDAKRAVDGVISFDKEHTDDEKKEMEERFRPEVEKNMNENQAFLHEKIDYKKLDEMKRANLDLVEVDETLCERIEKAHNSRTLAEIRRNFKSMGFFKRIVVFLMDVFLILTRFRCAVKKSNGLPLFKYDYYLFRKHFAFKLSDLTKKRITWLVEHNVIQDDSCADIV